MNFRDLERLQRRINKVQQVHKPPTLKMLVINEEPDEEGNPVTPEFGDLVHEHDPWTMVIKVEKKPKDWGK